MGTTERVVEHAVELVRREVDGALRRKRRRRRRRRQTWRRLLRAALWIAITTFVVVPAMIAGGFLFGPTGVEGLISAPLLLIALWSAILYWQLARKPALRAVVDASLQQLPERTEEWLERRRRELPYAAQSSLERLGLQLESLPPQLAGLDPQQPAAVELRRLLAEELPQLVEGYQRVPRQLRAQASHGGTSPEQQLVEGLSTITEQLARIHERLAAEDLRALATHKRYLELKYKGDDELD